MMSCIDPCWPLGAASSRSGLGRHAVSPQIATPFANWDTARRSQGHKEMRGKEKSTDPGLSAAVRKNLRAREAQEAIADHLDAQNAFQENRERLRAERLAREAAEGPMLAPTPALPRMIYSSTASHYPPGSKTRSEQPA